MSVANDVRAGSWLVETSFSLPDFLIGSGLQKVRHEWVLQCSVPSNNKYRTCCVVSLYRSDWQISKAALTWRYYVQI